MKVSKILNFIYILVVFIFVLSFNMFARGWIEIDMDWYYQDSDGEFVIDTIKTSGEKKILSW